MESSSDATPRRAHSRGAVISLQLGGAGKPMKTVLLYDIGDAYLIIDAKTGVAYRNQVAGFCRASAEQEGILVPLSGDDTLVVTLTTCSFPDDGQGITAREADSIDGILHARSDTRFLSVDRRRLKDSRQAWIFVEWSEIPNDYLAARAMSYYGPVYGFEAGSGVLTWPNSG